VGVSPTFFLLRKFRTTNLFSDHSSLLTRHLLPLHFSISVFKISAFTSVLFPIDIILNENPVPIRDRLPVLAKETATTIDKTLVRNPKDRFPDAEKLLAAIR